MILPEHLLRKVLGKDDDYKTELEAIFYATLTVDALVR